MMPVKKENSSFCTMGAVSKRMRSSTSLSRGQRKMRMIKRHMGNLVEVFSQLTCCPRQ